MQPLRVFIVAPAEIVATELQATLRVAGYAAKSNWSIGYGYPDQYRENRPNMLSSAELRMLAQDITDEIISRSDVLVSVHNRTESGSQGSTFWAGVAFAEGISTVVLGAFDEAALYLPHIITEEIGDVVAGLKKAEKQVENQRKSNVQSDASADDRDSQRVGDGGDESGASVGYEGGGGI